LKNFIKTQKESCTEVRKRKRVGELFLTSEQKSAFRVVQKHASLSREGRLREPLHLVVSSEAGAGKSHLLFAIATLLSSSGIPFELVGFTGTLAHQLCGKTIHGFLGLGNRCINYNLISDLPVPVFVKQNILALEYLILDEVYFLNAGLFHVLDDRLRTIFNSNSPFGGKISVIFAGDCFQTVVGTSLYKTSATLGDADQEGIRVFRAIEKVVLLKNNVRQRGDDRFLKLLKDIRFKQVDEEDLSLLQSRLHKNFEEEKSSFDSSLHIYPYNKLVDQFNEQKVRELGVPVLRGFDDQIREFARLSLKDCLQADDNEQPPTKKVRFDLSPQLEDGRRSEPVSNLLQTDANV
jgi:hypothetical protein